MQVKLDISLGEFLGQRGHVARLARVKHGPVIRRRRGGAPLRKLRLRDHAGLVLSEVSVLEIPAAVRALGDLGPVLLAAVDADPHVQSLPPPTLAPARGGAASRKAATIFSPWKRPFSMNTLLASTPAIITPARYRPGTFDSNVSGSTSGFSVFSSRRMPSRRMSSKSAWYPGQREDVVVGEAVDFSRLHVPQMHAGGVDRGDLGPETGGDLTAVDAVAEIRGRPST